MLHMVSYKLKSDRVAENERLAAAVYVALREARPHGLRYATFKLADGVSFMHVVSATSGDVLTSLPAFQAFRENLPQRIEPGSRTGRHRQSLGA